MSSYRENRHHPRVHVQWPAICFTSRVFSHGMVIDVSPLAWRIRAAMPVYPGMLVAVRAWPQESPSVEIEEGRVLWARDQDFALEIFQVRAEHEVAMIKLQEQTIGRKRQELDATHTDQQVVGHLASDTVKANLPERRQAIRVLAHCHVHYRQTDCYHGALEEGFLQDLSMTGCKFVSRASLEPGRVITLILYFNDGHPPINLPGTNVCWARDHRFGVRFPEITSGERKRLQEIVGSDGKVLASNAFNHNGWIEDQPPERLSTLIAAEERQQNCVLSAKESGLSQSNREPKT